ncbi:unnamed protein product [Adineta ricciae]|uniref:F-box domain-containing protein n=1 Tax=Adineta ricciae TaxID=249248 RepID=A0A814Z804_ADIRI|nr:unnamed protein product [Adineta ricciae]CAF1575862.1 unnamed protein product [Adineta ricciae]
MTDKRQYTSPYTPSNKKVSCLKRSKHEPTVMEDLPTELLLETFSYLNSVDVIYCFTPLNQRFRILVHAHQNKFDFKSVSKAKMKRFIHEHNRLAALQWKILRLSDDEHTPGQIAFFFEQFPYQQHTSQLKFLSLIHMKPNYAQRLLPQLEIFTSLVSLTLGNICGKQIGTLNLPLLRSLTITSCKYNKWIQSLQQLKNLDYNIKLDCVHEHSLIWPTTLEHLKIYFTQWQASEHVYASLQYLAQLKSLAIYDNSWAKSYPNGNRWQNLIESSLPLLTKFQFCFKFWYDTLSLTDINQILSTFTTLFYQKKRCFVQCDTHSNQFHEAVLYSLPFAFDQFELHTDSFARSKTTLNDIHLTHKNFFRKVETLIVNVKCDDVNSNLQNDHVQHLVLTRSDILADWLFSMVYVRQLSLCNQIDMLSKDFFHLIKNMPCLDSLNTSFTKLTNLTDEWKSKLIRDQLSAKVRSLNLSFDQNRSYSTLHYVGSHEILSILDVFAEKCEHLTILISSKNIITDSILPTMRKLQSLTVYLKTDDQSIITHDWLTKQDIVKDLDCSFTINNDECTFWISNQ